MAKIPFDIKFRPQIESGEYKVETRDGRPVRIICWDRVAKENTDDDLNICVLVPEDNGEGVYYYHQSGKKWVSDERFDLFIVTPVPELTKFEESLWSFLKLECSPIDHIEKLSDSEKMLFHKYAAELLELARKEIEEELKEKVLHDYWKQASDQCAQERKEAKAEALKEFEEKYKQSWFNEGKIAGRFEGLTEDEKYQQGVHDGKEEALNDLPRWKKLPNGIMKQVNLFGRAIIVNSHYILYSDLEKLPGFKED